MKRAIPILILFLLLVVFPLGSYLYLSRGIDYRLVALDKVAPKGELIPFDYYKDGIKFDQSTLNHKTILLHIDESNTNDDYIQRIYNQFNQSPNLELLQISSDSLPQVGEGFNKVYSPDIMKLISTYANKDIILIDTALQVRSYYDLNDSTLNELVRDIAVVLPLQKKATIKMTDR